jgi:protoheme IX farnesyltransferase
MGKYIQLTRPRIVTMVLFALTVAAWTCGEQPPAWPYLLQVLFGMTLITGGSVAMNQWYEQWSDALMARTQNRPIPTGRVSSPRALAFGLALSLAGALSLLVTATGWVAGLAVLNWLFYVACYTPLKSRSVWQLPVGSVAGAMPMLIGGAVAGVPLNGLSWALFGLQFFWQFPHAIAIAWIYRQQYARAGLRVASVHDPSGRLSGWLAGLGGIVLLPVSLLPVWLGEAYPWYGAVAVLLGLAYLWPTIRFWRSHSDLHARHVLWASFAHLPLVLIALLCSMCPTS